MENLDNLPTTVQPEPNDLQEQYESLRHLVVSALVLILVVSGTFDLYLWRQVRFANMDLAQARPQSQQVAAELNKVSGPVIQDFARKLLDYGKKNPDFAPILAKYRLSDVVGKAPAAMAAPAGAPSKK